MYALNMKVLLVLFLMFVSFVVGGVVGAKNQFLMDAAFPQNVLDASGHQYWVGNR
jgi:hypothetical protein